LLLYATHISVFQSEFNWDGHSQTFETMVRFDHLEKSHVGVKKNLVFKHDETMIQPWVFNSSTHGP